MEEKRQANMANETTAEEYKRAAMQKVDDALVECVKKKGWIIIPGKYWQKTGKAGKLCIQVTGLGTLYLRVYRTHRLYIYT